MIPAHRVAVGIDQVNVAEHLVEQGLDLKHAEMQSDAFVGSTAEWDPREAVALVLASPFAETFRVEIPRTRPVLGGQVTR